ncbi:hypothetical protein [Alysiella filiformis]|nr:hypothetical protein [Alysiella filiformis]
MLLMLAILVPMVFKKGKSQSRKILNAIGTSAGIIVLFVRIIPMLLMMALGPSKAERQAAEEWQRKYQTAEAVFKQQCEKAGEKIYRTVENVEGILLLNIVPESTHSDWSNPNWEYAALMKEFPKEGYIHDFLRKKRIKISQPTEQDLTVHIPFNANPADYVFQNGYQFIDVLQDNKYYRYTVKQMPSRVDFNIEEIKKPVRYAVKFETHNHPEYRKHWVAGVHFSIIDTWDNTILAEKTIYSFDPKQGGPNYGRKPWENAVYCPYEDYQNSLIQARFFVDKVLKPRQIQERKNDNVN